MTTLEVVAAQPPRVIALTGEPVRIGRLPTCALPLSDARCSKLHAELLPTPDGGWLLHDLNATNGTFLDGVQLAPDARVPLTDGQRIVVGDTELLFRSTPPTAAPVVPDDATVVGPSGDADLPDETIVRTLPASDDLPDLAGGVGGKNQVDALRFLLDLARAAEGADDLERLAAVLEDGLGHAIVADRAFLFIGRDDAMEPFPRARTLAPRAAGQPFSRTVLRRAATGRVACLAHLGTDRDFRAAASVAAQRIASAIAVPLLAGGELLGCLYADRIAPAEPFAEADLELAAAAGRQCALALLNVGRLDGLRAERDRLAAELTGSGDFIGQSDRQAKVYDFIQRAAPTSASVLILGESGTGKELVARAIHRGSPRRDRPLVIVNCAALPPTLAESELFGHERGAFTGADRARSGHFLAADRGTIFLDEIGELPEAVQAKLLRVLEEGEVTPVGDSRSRRVDVRVVAATNRDLAAEVKAGRFRPDLYYRLNILRIELPPLRERGDDVRLLAEHFTQFYGQRCGRPRVRLAPETVAACLRHTWPGNVRELRNAVERAVILADGDTILPDDLPPEVAASATPFPTGPAAHPHAPAPATTPAADASAPAEWNAENPPPTLGDLEKRHVLAVLAWCGGNKKQAADRLGIDRSTLYARLRAYGVET